MANTVLSLLLLAILSVHSALADTPVNTASFLEMANVPTEEFEIKFANLHINYKMAVFPQDDRICDKAFLLVFIPTRPSSFNIRDAIRSSWGKDGPQSVIVKFIIGQPADPELFYLLLGEQKMHGDLILYSIKDSYNNLYLKVHAAFQWQQTFCSNAKYVLKTDDDTIVDLNRLNYWITNEMADQQKTHTAIIFGGVWKGAAPIRSWYHKWYISPSLYPLSKYPDYTNGPTYLLSSEAVSTILRTAKEIISLHLEDVLYTGIVAAKAGIPRIDSWKHFRNGDKLYKKENCSVTDRVPYVLALFGTTSAADYAKKYERLRNVKCA